MKGQPTSPWMLVWAALVAFIIITFFYEVLR